MTEPVDDWPITMLKGKANALAERVVDVVQTKHGKYVVEWMSFSDNPSPVGDTEEEALKEFVKYMLKRRNDRGSILENDTVNSPGEADDTANGRTETKS